MVNNSGSQKSSSFLFAADDKVVVCVVLGAGVVCELFRCEVALGMLVTANNSYAEIT